MDRTVLVGIGAQKAATTWLARQLETHPEVAMAWPKELHYWDTVRAPATVTYRERARARLRRLDGPWGLRRVLPGRWGTPTAARRAAEAYLALLSEDGSDPSAWIAYLCAGAGQARVVGEVTPAYALLTARSFAEIAGAAPDTRFVFVMRDPLARLVSGVRYHARRFAGRPGAAEAVAERAFVGALDSEHDPHLRRSRYDETIDALESAVPRERILYLFYETLFGDESRDAVTRFLGLSTPPAWNAEARENDVVRVAWRPDPMQEARALACLAPTYEALRRRFGQDLPAAWSAPAGPKIEGRTAT